VRHMRNSNPSARLGTGFEIRNWSSAIFLITFLLFLCANAPAVEAQQPQRVPRVGVLSTATQSAPPMTLQLDAFLQGLRELGFVEGETIVFEYRSAEGNPDRLAGLAAELVRLKVDCIVTAGDSPSRAAKQATSTIPIVMANTSNPIQAGLVGSFARPGGNITGLASVSVDLAGKRLELLKEVVPKLSRVAFFSDPRSPDGSLAETEGAARAQGVQVNPLEVRSLGELEDAFRAAAKSRTSALIIGWGGLFVTHRARIIALADKYRLPAMYPEQEYVPAGGLMAYAANTTELYRRAAVYVDKILRGAKPGDLPIEQPTMFELVVNLKTARSLGLTIPESVRLRADEVIR
jgi:putative tryptophan/tyrosine transport system substrate-binding protein